MSIAYPQIPNNETFQTVLITSYRSIPSDVRPLGEYWQSVLIGTLIEEVKELNQHRHSLIVCRSVCIVMLLHCALCIKLKHHTFPIRKTTPLRWAEGSSSVTRSVENLHQSTRFFPPSSSVNSNDVAEISSTAESNRPLPNPRVRVTSTSSSRCHQGQIPHSFLR